MRSFARVKSPAWFGRLMIVWTSYWIVFVTAAACAFLLRFDFHLGTEERFELLYGLFFWIPIKTLGVNVFGVNRVLHRYASLPDLLRVAAALFASTVVSTVCIALTDPSFPRSIYVLDFLLSLLGAGAMCVMARLHNGRRARSKVTRRTRVLVYGAGSAGQKLVRELRNNSQLGYEVVGYIDDDPLKRNGRLHGLPIMGNGDLLPKLADENAVMTVLVAMPSANGEQMTRILDKCSQAGLAFKTIPSAHEIVEGRGLAKQIREVAVEDLLGRTQIRLEQEQIAGLLSGKTVLVTGAAGSIGSELCRQIARFNPAAIIALDIAESALFYLELEIRERFPHITFLPQVANICDELRLREVFAKFNPSVVFHAAAYKHVPMMERHLFCAVENNVLGTANVAAIAALYGVQKFVMISTDKAVHPSSIMGVTKRIAELFINSLTNSTMYVSVRFGNVLGSNGSVVPIFQKQIREGGPVTVTHPEMRRYFMTIPEASQLVLQAAAMGEGGEIFVLDMGQPVLITELARKLIRLSGLQPDIDIKITYTGIRPGEKLLEELTEPAEGALPTYHEKIQVYQGRRTAESEMRKHIQLLSECCRSRDGQRLLSLLKVTVPDYRTSEEMVLRQNAVEPELPGDLSSVAAVTT